MGLFGRIFGADEAISKGVDVLAKGLDSLVYTAEEKAQDHQKTITQGRKMLVEWIAASLGQRLARRIIALSVTAVWLFLKIAGAALSVVAVWVDNNTQFTQSSEIIASHADSMQGAVMLILGFYFAAPYLGDMVKPAMEKFNKKNH